MKRGSLAIKIQEQCRVTRGVFYQIEQKDVAKYFNHFEIFTLHGDNTESVIEDLSELEKQAPANNIEYGIECEDVYHIAKSKKHINVIFTFLNKIATSLNFTMYVNDSKIELWECMDKTELDLLESDENPVVLSIYDLEGKKGNDLYFDLNEVKNAHFDKNACLIINNETSMFTINFKQML